MTDATSSYKEYIGDAIYADCFFVGEIILTTEDGVSVTNRIVLGPAEWQALQGYVKRLEARLEAIREEDDGVEPPSET